MRAALIRYRVIAYIVGVLLIVLVLIGVPLKYIWNDSRVVDTVGTAHGYLYMIYLLATFDLGRRARWSLSRMARVMLAGTIPFLSFYAERVATRWIREQERRQQREPEPIAG